jgi:hypothetical protein
MEHIVHVVSWFKGYGVHHWAIALLTSHAMQTGILAGELGRGSTMISFKTSLAIL